MNNLLMYFGSELLPDNTVAFKHVSAHTLFCTCVKLGLLTLREEHRLRVFENAVLRKKHLYLKEGDYGKDETKYIMLSLINCALHLILRRLNKGG
jgi:hypothetical protein